MAQVIVEVDDLTYDVLVQRAAVDGYETVEMLVHDGIITAVNEWTGGNFPVGPPPEA